MFVQRLLDRTAAQEVLDQAVLFLLRVVQAGPPVALGSPMGLRGPGVPSPTLPGTLRRRWPVCLYEDSTLMINARMRVLKAKETSLWGSITRLKLLLVASTSVVPKVIPIAYEKYAKSR